MESFKRDLCTLIFELTYHPVKDIMELKSGRHLRSILQLIDPQFFEAEDCDSWADAKAGLERFLSFRGIENKSLNLELDQIAAGSVESLVSSVVQVLSLLAVFQPAKWKEAISYADPSVVKSTCKVIDGLAEELEAKLGDVIAPRVKVEEERTLKGILMKLELTESRLETSESTVHQLRKEIASLRRENSEKDNAIELQQSELMEASVFKDQLLRQMEGAMKNKGHASEEVWQQKIDSLTRELEESSRRLFDLRNKIIEKDDEISKKELHITIMSEKQANIEQLEEQVRNYKRLTDSLKKDNEALELRLKREVNRQAENEDNLKKEAALIAAECNHMKASLVKAKNHVVTYKRRAELAEERLKLVSRKSISNSEHQAQILSYVQMLRKMEGQIVDLKVNLQKVREAKDMEGVQLVLSRVNGNESPRANKRALRKVVTSSMASIKEGEADADANSSRPPYSSMEHINDLDFGHGSNNADGTLPSKLDNGSLDRAIRRASRDSGLESESERDHGLSTEAAAILYSAFSGYLLTHTESSGAYFGTSVFRRREILKHFQFSNLLESVMNGN